MLIMVALPSTDRKKPAWRCGIRKRVEVDASGDAHQKCLVKNAYARQTKGHTF
jgi:hypothetical protein